MDRSTFGVAWREQWSFLQVARYHQRVRPMPACIRDAEVWCLSPSKAFLLRLPDVRHETRLRHQRYVMPRWIIFVLGTMCTLALLLFPSAPLVRATTGHGESPHGPISASPDRSVLLLDRILAAGNPVGSTFPAPSGFRAKSTGESGLDASIERASELADVSSNNAGLAGTISGRAGTLLLGALPIPVLSGEGDFGNMSPDKGPASRPALLERGQMEALLMPGDHLRSVGNLPTAAQEKIKEEECRLLEIEVSHSGHVLRLLRREGFDKTDVLHECRVGLGAPSFPTPVGTYFVTHIYDQDPWWIPPPNRAWAAGQSPSRKVYGGTMAPLLKKRPAKSKKTEWFAEDMVELPVSLEDYGYRFHGTNAPRSIGRNESHGCVRMLPADAKKVASLIKEHVGVANRLESANGSFVILKSPIRLNLIK